MKSKIKIILLTFFVLLISIDAEAQTPDTPILNNFSEVQLCAQDNSVFDGGCCSGAAGLPTLRWNFAILDTLCDSNASPMTTPLNFQGVPTAVANNAQDNLCLGWSGYSYQVSYWLQVDNNIGFTSPEINTGQVSSGVQSYTISVGEVPVGTYYWRVGAKDQYGTVTAWATADHAVNIPLDCTYVPGAGNPGVAELDGSEFQVCTINPPVQPACYDGTFPVPIFNWTFSPTVSTWHDGDGNPFTTAIFFNGVYTETSAPSDNSGILVAATQQGYYFEIATDLGFTNIIYRTGWVPSAVSQHQVCMDVLDYNTTYYWRVAVKDTYDSYPSSVWAVEANPFTTALPCAPDAPTDTEVQTIPQPLACAYLTVRWTDNSDNEDGFLVQRSINGTSGWVNACDVSANINSCTTLAVPDSTWYFRISAYNSNPLIYSPWDPLPGAGTGGLDGIAGTTEPFCAPVLLALSYNCDCVNLVWTVLGDESQVDHYVIERKIDASPWNVLEASQAQGVMYYSDCDIDSGVDLYVYKVTAYEDPAETVAVESSETKVVEPCPNLPMWYEDK